jgi:osmoprotectant transport system ATP-binding protein
MLGGRAIRLPILSPDPTMTDTPMIAFRSVTKRFPNASAAAVGDLSFDVAEGETLVLIGPSGCGKTTTMRMINRLIEPTGGQILVAGKDAAAVNPVELRRGIGYVIQSVGLLPHRDVAHNIATVPGLLGWDRARIDARVRELSELFELDDELLRRYPSELSGGQRQRVGVARALAGDPPIMLMDEPFAAVDPIIRGRLQDQFLDIQRRLRKTIVFVTHDVDEAIKMGDRMAILNVGGVLEQLAPPGDVLRAPANDFVARFVGTERSLKRLSLIRVGDLHLDHREAVGNATATIATDATLLEALDALLSAPGRVVRVTDGPNGDRGMLTLDDITRELAK